MCVIRWSRQSYCRTVRHRYIFKINFTLESKNCIALWYFCFYFYKSTPITPIIKKGQWSMTSFVKKLKWLKECYKILSEFLNHSFCADPKKWFCFLLSYHIRKSNYSLNSLRISKFLNRREVTYSLHFFYEHLETK